MPGSIVPLTVMLDEEDQAVYENLKPPTSMVVRYGYQKRVAELPYGGDAKPGCGSKLVVETDRGTEIAEMLTTTCPNSGCYKSVSRKQMLQYIDNSGGKDYPFTTKGRVLRVATIQDMNEQSRLDDLVNEDVKACRRVAGELKLELSPVHSERLLGGERMTFYFKAPDRVDFRELVKRLAAEYHTRIEMQQVNDREEARLVADYEKCGQYCCCKNFLKVLKPISMRSAKVQKATLDPHKISGRCGRLMCCLRYEDETYDELRKRLPHRKSRVKTEDGEGIVLSSQILTQLILVALDDGSKPQAYPLENIEVLPPKKSAKKKKKPGGDQNPSGGQGKQNAKGAAAGEGNAKTDEPRRPRPGKPLKDNEVRSREGKPSANLESRPDDRTNDGQRPPKKKRSANRSNKPQDDNANVVQNGPIGAVSGESDEQVPAKKKRRRRRRRKRKSGGEGGGESGGGGQPEGGGDRPRNTGPENGGQEG